ncbi:hypothetical protein J27TS7_14110 [Paenibacillus dendritiformis]|nr:hypothetical protein J27TS7_14110 [Paenibacillus dendritiformis]
MCRIAAFRNGGAEKICPQNKGACRGQSSKNERASLSMYKLEARRRKGIDAWKDDS